MSTTASPPTMDEQKNPRIFRMQPILCPWITSQPYHSSLWNKNRASNQNDPTLTNRFLNNPWINRQMPLGIPRSQDKALPSIQQSSSQFFYFLRLMQLFPDTHPATLHTVLVLCKNDFFCAVDKMLYAKRCKLLCYKKNLIQKTHQSRNSKNVCHSNGAEAMTSKANVKGFQRMHNQVNKGQATIFSSSEKKKEESAVASNMQEMSESSLIMNSVAERAEDLSTIKKNTTKSTSQVQDC